MPDRTPELSFLVVTDTYETVRPVVERLRRQTIATGVELVLVCPDRGKLGLPEGAAPELAAVTVLECPIQPLSESRAVGVQGARGGIVFVGETHVYPGPDFAACIVAAHEANGWGGVTPAIGNANPRTRRSWAGLLLDYGTWAGGSAGPIGRAPSANVSLRSDLVPRSFEELSEILRPPRNLSDFLLRSGGLYHQPAARLDHQNVTAPLAWLDERYLCGRLVGGSRARAWSRGRRLAYAAATPLIACVLFGRAIRMVRHVSRRRLGIGLLVGLGVFLQACGEAVGYLVGRLETAERRMLAYEIHKLRHASAE